MSIFEWLGERWNPGPEGQVDMKRELLIAQTSKRTWIILLMLAAVALVAVAIWLIIESERSWLTSLLLLLYLVFCYFFSAKPDYSNIGLFGVIDHPLRMSDDVNRWLVLLYLFLLPGKIIVFGLQTIYGFIKRK